MAIESIGSVQAEQSSSLQRVGLNQEDFLKILLAQLTFQDPLKPTDNQEFIAQMAQFSALEQSRQANDRMETLLTIQTSDQSLGLLGKTVEIVTPAGNQVGIVTTIEFAEGVPSLTIKNSAGEFITGASLSQIRIVR